MFSKLQYNKIKHALHKGDLPIKYSYITTEWALAWAELERSKKTCSGGYSYDAGLLKETIDLYLSELDDRWSVTIFDFGSGIWQTVIPTILFLESQGILVNYHAFDISDNIISLLRENFRSSGVSAKIDHTIIDFEEKDLSDAIFAARRQYGDVPVLGLFLGNTVGNFASIERVLSNIMDALDLRDKLAIGIERVDLENERWLHSMLAWYRTELSHRHDFATLASLWFRSESGKFEVVFNRSHSAVEVKFVFTEDVLTQVDGDIFRFDSWEGIRIFRSKKINEETFSRILVGMNLRICNLRTSRDNCYLQVLVENKRFH